MKFHTDGGLPDYPCIFVFGSNLAGYHGAGAARVAFEKFGALMGHGVGQVGSSYAIPTKDFRITTLPIAVIATHIQYFLAHARQNPDTEYFVTAIGCGLAGFNAWDIAPFFKNAPDNCSLPDTWRGVL